MEWLQLRIRVQCEQVLGLRFPLFGAGGDFERDAGPTLGEGVRSVLH